MKSYFKSSFYIETLDAAHEILNHVPSSSTESKKEDFIIQGLEINKYLVGLIEGNPEKALYGELVKPVLSRCGNADTLEKVNASLEGFHYIIPAIFKGKIEGWRDTEYSRLPTWSYTVYLVDKTLDSELHFSFWTEKLLSEEQLISFIKDNANWSLSREYLI